MKKQFLPFIFFLVLIFAVMACASSVSVGNKLSSSDEVATIVASTLQALTPATSDLSVEAPDSANLLPRSFYYLGTDNATGLMQVFRIERDGVTTRQLTFEPTNVGSYDVSSVDGSVVYISNNQMFWVDASGAGRRLLVDGGPVDVINPFINTLRQPVFSPSGKIVAYSYKGLNFYSMDSGISSLIVENKLHDAGNGGIFPEELYSPARYSPDGTKLLVTLGYYEGASSAIYTVASNTLVRLNGGEGALICCGTEVWTSDGSAFYSANPTTGMFNSGLWKVDASNGVVTTLFANNYDTGVFNYANVPYLAPDGQLYYFFFTSNSEISTRTPLQIVRSAPDGVTGRTALRSDTFALMNEALWAPDASFVIVAFAPIQDVYYGGQAEVTYLDGRPSVVLTTFAQNMKWGP